jgi:hypothetical protein
LCCARTAKAHSTASAGTATARAEIMPSTLAEHDHDCGVQSQHEYCNGCFTPGSQLQQGHHQAKAAGICVQSRTATVSLPTCTLHTGRSTWQSPAGLTPGAHHRPSLAACSNNIAAKPHTCHIAGTVGRSSMQPYHEGFARERPDTNAR